MASIKVIETRYRGYRFRSRLEARWALALDVCGVKWQYEVDGYVLPSGPYLPDFRLDVYGRKGPWIEIKGAEPTDRECKLMRELCAAHSMYGFIVWGTPGDEGWRHFDKEGDEMDSSEMMYAGYSLAEYLNVIPEMFQIAAMDARAARFERGWRA